MSGSTKCNAEETENQLTAAGIDVLKIKYNSKEEAIIEDLIKLVDFWRLWSDMCIQSIFDAK